MKKIIMKLAILSDFDGTITNLDTCCYILNQLAKEEWEIYDELYEQGKISLEEAMKKQFSLLKTPKKQMLDTLDKVTTIREGFYDLVDYCCKKHIPLTIISAGLDFIIKHFIDFERYRKCINLVAAKTRISSTGIDLFLPKMYYQGSNSFKDDRVKYMKKQGYKTIFVGDGMADYYPAKIADHVFVIKGSQLSIKLIELIKIFSFKKSFDDENGQCYQKEDYNSPRLYQPRNTTEDGDQH